MGEVAVTGNKGLKKDRRVGARIEKNHTEKWKFVFFCKKN